MGRYIQSEADIQKKIVEKLRGLKWSVRETHGNMYQRGFPDLFCAHLTYGIRWVEVKHPDRRGDLFTPSQHSYFYELLSVGVGVWILTSADPEEIALLHKEPNWHAYLRRH